ncbi:MAG: TrkA family potassium uptake protein [Candidatus Latescibacteria bacterium]|nr:TrkA family potassium uptake protein [Candidatus Latescibacterota bacterium]
MKRFLVIGLGQFGYELAKALTDKGAEVIAIDRNMNLVEGVKDFVTSAVNLDSTDEDALRSLNLDGLEAAIVAIGEDWEASILTTAILKELGIENIIARRAGDIQGKILEKIGATRIISPEINIADQLARNLISPGVLEHIALPDGHTIFQVEARPEFYNKTLIELDFRRNFGLLVVGIQRKKANVTESGEVYMETENISLPSATEAIKQGDILVLVGMKADIETFISRE